MGGRVIQLIATIISNMSRQHSTLLRGASQDERAKNKTKKHRNHLDQERRPQPIPSRVSEGDSRNIDVLLAVAESMAETVHRQNAQYKSRDAEILKLTIQELKLLRRIEDEERAQNRQKVMELRDSLHHAQKKKMEVLQTAERIETLMKSGSPRERKGVIACEMSPSSHYPHHLGLIERKIEEDNREKATFQAMRKKEQCFDRVFECINRIADSLSVPRSDKNNLYFKGFYTRIEDAVEVGVRREGELRAALKEAERGGSEVCGLREQNESLIKQNMKLQGELDALSQELRQIQAAHHAEIQEEQRKLNSLQLQQTELQRERASLEREYAQLEQDFEMITKEKLDAETSLSQECRRQKEAARMLQRKARKIRDCVKEAKYLQGQLRQTAREHKNNLECYSRQAFNELICAFTQELLRSALKRNREMAELQAEMNKNIVGRDEEREREVEVKKSRMAIIGLREICIKGEKERFLGIFEAEGFTCYGLQKTRIEAHTQFCEQVRQLTLQSQLFKVLMRPTEKSLNIEKVMTFVYTNTRQYANLGSQTDENGQKPPMLECHSQTLQTSLEAEIQAVPIQISIASQPIPVCFTITSQLAYDFAPPSNTLLDASTSTLTPVLACTEAFNEAMSFPKQTTEQASNTDNDSICRSPDRKEETEEESECCPQSSPKEEQESDNQILSLLLEAEECTMVPEICLLREQIMVYRQQIERLSKAMSVLQSEREHETFQFRL